MIDIGALGLSPFELALTFAFPALIGLLGLIRAVIASGASRVCAVAALILAWGTLGLVLADLPKVGFVAAWLVILQDATDRFGWGVWVAVLSLPLVLSALVEGRRWWGVDLVHLVLVAGLTGLWYFAI